MSGKATAKITGLGAYVPERVLTNQDLEKLVDTNDEWIVTRTGIRERRIAREDEHCSDMAEIAAKQAMESAGKTAEEIDLILVSTCTPDYLFPSTAAIVQGKLGATKAAALDYQAACTGFVYGLSVAKAFVESGLYKNVLLIAAEKLSPFVDFEDRATCILFGDGAAAAWICDDPEGLEIEHVQLGANGTEAGLVRLPGGGSRHPANGKTLSDKMHFLQMEGQEIFKHAIRNMLRASNECLAAMNLTADDVEWMVPHQANKRIIDGIAKRLDFPLEKIKLTVQKYGNTSASSVPIALHELMEEETLKPDARLLLTSFGAGLTWGSAIIRNVVGAQS